MLKPTVLSHYDNGDLISKNYIEINEKNAQLIKDMSKEELDIWIKLHLPEPFDLDKAFAKAREKVLNTIAHRAAFAKLQDRRDAPGWSMDYNLIYRLELASLR